MIFRIDIDLANDAFQRNDGPPFSSNDAFPDPGDELCHILVYAASKLWPYKQNDSCVLRDSNGNTVGAATVEGDE